MEVQGHLQRIRKLRQEIWREEIEIASKVPSVEKMLAGPRLFERACTDLKARIKEQHPSAGEQEVVERLRDALDMVRRLEDLGCAIHLPNDTLDAAYFVAFPLEKVGDG